MIDHRISRAETWTCKGFHRPWLHGGGGGIDGWRQYHRGGKGDE